MITSSPGRIHEVLGHSYTVYFVAIIAGFIADSFFPFRIFSSFFMSLGFVFMVFASFLIYWAQHTSGRTASLRKNISEITAKDFRQGPYVFFRSPTHIGLFFLSFGVGLMANSAVIASAALIAFLVTHFKYVREEEAILLARYGNAYRDYKKIVRF